MSSAYDFYKRKMNIHSTSGHTNLTLGDKLKAESDKVMEITWDRDIQAKKAYIYDYFHDDQPDKNKGMTYENTTKTSVDIKFIVKSYQSVDKDQVEFYLQFRPSQKFEFDKDDELYYFETGYKNIYKSSFPIGLYVDIPNSRGVYEKWIIVDQEYANQFQKFLILPCDYQLMWIEKRGQDRIKRKMWSVLRNQNSYTIGTYSDRVFTHPDNQNKIWLPLNKYTEKFWYNDDMNKTMRLIVSAPTEYPIVWSVTKIENTKPIGLQKLTIYQNFWNEHTDFIERDSDGNIIGMYANYFDSEILPEDTTHLIEDIPFKSTKIEASSSFIKIGGSYKLLTAKLFSENNEDISDSYKEASFKWSCFVEEIDLSDKVIWLPQPENKMKIKFPNDKTFMGKILKIRCDVLQENSETPITILAEFELTN